MATPEEIVAASRDVVAILKARKLSSLDSMVLTALLVGSFAAASWHTGNRHDLALAWLVTSDRIRNLFRDGWNDYFDFESAPHQPIDPDPELLDYLERQKANKGGDDGAN